MKHSSKVYIWGGTDSDGADTHKVFCPTCGHEILRGRFVVAIDIPSQDGVARFLLARKAPLLHCGGLIASPRFFYTKEEAVPAFESVEERVIGAKGDPGRIGLELVPYILRTVVSL
jgi:hypothetical protein